MAAINSMGWFVCQPRYCSDVFVPRLFCRSDKENLRISSSSSLYHILTFYSLTLSFLCLLTIIFLILVIYISLSLPLPSSFLSFNFLSLSFPFLFFPLLPLFYYCVVCNICVNSLIMPLNSDFRWVPRKSRHEKNFFSELYGSEGYPGCLSWAMWFPITENLFGRFFESTLVFLDSNGGKSSHHRSRTNLDRTQDRARDLNTALYLEIAAYPFSIAHLFLLRVSLM